jgi:hypothetical protein
MKTLARGDRLLHLGLGGFNDLFDRVLGTKPFDAPRGTVAEDEFERGMLRFAEVS